MGRPRTTKKKDDGAPRLAGTFFDRALRLVALSGVYLALLAPVVVADFTAYPFVFLKALFFQATIALTVPAFLLLAWRQPAFRPRRSWISLALGAYLLALSLSCIFAFHRHRAFWGSQDRMGGLFSLAHFFVWYVMVTSLLRTWRQWRRLLHWQLVLGLFVAGSALVEIGDPQIDRISGVLGNPIYTGMYQLFTIGILALLWVRTRSFALRVLYAVSGAGSLVTLMYTGSRGSMVGLVSGVMIGVSVWTFAGRHWRYLFAAVGSFLLAAVGYASVVRWGASLPGLRGLAHLFTKTTYEQRPLIWSTAWSGFRDHPLLGWGPGNFEAVWDTHFLPRNVCLGSFDTWTDIAHSLLFEHLSTTGALGTLALAAVWVAFALSLRRAFRQGWLEARAYYVLLGLAVAYLAQGQFITDSPSSYMMLFLLLAVGCAAGTPEFALKSIPPGQPFVDRPLGLTPWTMAVLQTGGILLAWHLSVLPAAASHAGLQSKVAFARGGCGAMLESARRAAAIPTPWSQDHFTVLSQTLRDLVKEDRLQSCPQWRDLYDLTRQSAAKVYAGQPEHFRFRASMAALTLMLGLKVGDQALLAEAELLYKALLAGSPQQQFYHYQLARLFAQTGRIDAGDDQLRQAVAADPQVGESVWRLGLYRWQYENQPQIGSQMLVQAAEGSCRRPLSNSDEAVVLGQAFGVQGNLAGLRSMERRMEELPAEDPRPSSAYRDIARFQEQAGLLAERDRMLGIAATRDATTKIAVAPVLGE
jgi:O-antigen ligase